jgi:hypothetical protein
MYPTLLLRRLRASESAHLNTPDQLERSPPYYSITLSVLLNLGALYGDAATLLLIFRSIII